MAQQTKAQVNSSIVGTVTLSGRVSIDVQDTRVSVTLDGEEMIAAVQDTNGTWGYECPRFAIVNASGTTVYTDGASLATHPARRSSWQEILDIGDMTVGRGWVKSALSTLDTDASTVKGKDAVIASVSAERDALAAALAIIGNVPGATITDAQRAALPAHIAAMLP